MSLKKHCLRLGCKGWCIGQETECNFFFPGRYKTNIHVKNKHFGTLKERNVMLEGYQLMSKVTIWREKKVYWIGNINHHRKFSLTLQYVQAVSQGTKMSRTSQGIIICQICLLIPKAFTKEGRSFFLWSHRQTQFLEEADYTMLSTSSNLSRRVTILNIFTQFG